MFKAFKTSKDLDRHSVANGTSEAIEHFEQIEHLYSSIYRRILAGLPATIVFGGTSRVTTLPAPMMAFSPMVTWDRTVEPEPMEAPFFTRVGSTAQSSSV